MRLEWALRRLDAVEAAIHDSVVRFTRKRIAGAHPAAALAYSYLGDPDKPEAEILALSQIQSTKERLWRQSERVSIRLAKAKERRESQHLQEQQTLLRWKEPSAREWMHRTVVQSGKTDGTLLTDWTSDPANESVDAANQ